MSKHTLRQSLLLLLTATIWGVAFVAQSVGMEYIGPFTFNAVRNIIGAVVLIPCIALLKRIEKSGVSEEKEGFAEEVRDVEALGAQSKKSVLENGQWNKTLLVGGVSCGVMLFIASNLQQIGIQYTTVGKAGFITAMYIVLVPILGIFLRKKVGARVWGAVLIAVIGLYMLCMTDTGFSLQRGDFYVLICAFAFAGHILVVDHFASMVDGVKMSCIQFLVCGVLSGICMLLFEAPDPSMILQAWLPVLYAGVLSSGVAYTLQIVGQRGMNPTVASLIMSLESVISVIAGWIILGQVLTQREILGCVLMFGATILVQLPERKGMAGLPNKE